MWLLSLFNESKVDISSEKQFNQIHETLQDIKDRLRDLDAKYSSPRTVSAESPLLTDNHHTPASGATFLGESSFDSQSVRASLSAEVSARDASQQDVGQQLKTSLSMLQAILQNQGQSSASTDMSFPHCPVEVSSQKVELPPVATVFAALKRAAGMWFSSNKDIVSHLSNYK